MEINSDSDKSYDIVSWDEFYQSVTDSDPEEAVSEEEKQEEEHKHEDTMGLANIASYKSDEEMENSDAEASENSSYGGSVDGDCDGSFGLSDLEDGKDDTNHMIDMLAELPEETYTAPVPINPKKRRMVPPSTTDEYPFHIKRREDMEIKDLVKDHALPFLPAKSLARFKAVSKEWNKWISSPFLAHKQTYLFRKLSGFYCQNGDYSTPTFIPLDRDAYGVYAPSLNFLPEKVSIRSSCYGLLLCQGLQDDMPYYVCNPVNREWRKTPQPNFYHGQDPAIVLAFEPSELNIPAYFDLVCAFPVIDTPMVYFEIYSSETKSWKLSSSECYELGGGKILGGGFYINKMAYYTMDTGHVLAFDIKNEVCGVLSLPLDCSWNGVLARMQGELRYVLAQQHIDRNEYELSIYGGMNMSRFTRNSIELYLGTGNKECRVLPFGNESEDDTVVILCEETAWMYNLKEKKGRIVGRMGKFGNKYLPFVNSLVCLPPE